MDDLISRQKVLATLDFADKALDEERTVEKYKELLTESIKALPPAENKGEWIEESDNYGHSSYFCSRCGTQEGKPSDICPNCRARMKGW